LTGAGEFRQRLGRVESLLLALEELPDTAAREAARELVGLVLDLHALGLRRVMELAGDDAITRLADDALVSSLLLLHNLHPLSATERLERVLDRARPRFHALGGDVQLVSATNEVVHFRLRGDPTAGSSLRAEAGELAIEVVPDVASIQFEENWDVPPASRLPLPILNGVSGDAL
jgi:hypothetical protein